MQGWGSSDTPVQTPETPSPPPLCPQPRGRIPTAPERLRGGDTSGSCASARPLLGEEIAPNVGPEPFLTPDPTLPST